MRAVDIIIKKRDGQELTKAEIVYFIKGFASGEIPDYQASAWAMAVLFKGMNLREITDLTLAMAASGQMIDLSEVVPIALDKHSTGGVGDKTTLVVEPLVAACGLPVGKMSGRGLGFSGGTIDKMESIPGFRTDLTIEEFIYQLRTVGLVLASQSVDLAPADGKLYALRDVTGTVPSIPLLASSIMSKKIAAGAQAIVLDVKIGLGAFLENLEEGRTLAETMVSIARLAGRKAVALLSDMNQPLGCAVGNALEVKEAIDTLKGRGPADFAEHCLTIAAHMLVLGGRASSEEEGLALAGEALESGKAWDYFRILVDVQGGDLDAVDYPEQLPKARWIETTPAPRSAYLAKVHARLVGETAVRLGAGRMKKGDPIDPAVGVVVHHKVGDWVEGGQPLFTIHASDALQMGEARQTLLEAHIWSDKQVQSLPLFYEVIRS